MTTPPPPPPPNKRSVGPVTVEEWKTPMKGWRWPSVNVDRNPWRLTLAYPQVIKTATLRVHGDELLGARTETVRWAAVAPLVHLARSQWFAGSLRRLPPRPWMVVPWTAALCTNLKTQITLDGVQHTATLGGPLSPAWPAWPASKNPPDPE